MSNLPKPEDYYGKVILARKRRLLGPLRWLLGKPAPYVWVILQSRREWSDPTYGNSAFGGSYSYYWHTLSQRYSCKNYSEVCMMRTIKKLYRDSAVTDTVFMCN